MALELSSATSRTRRTI